MLVLIIGVVLLSASLTGFFIRRLSLMMRPTLGMLAFGAFILCAHRDLVAQPITMMAAMAMSLTFFFWRFIQRRRLDSLTTVN